MCNLGFCYYQGIGVEENDEEAVKWFAKAAERGQPRALFLLGECYEEGNGVKADLNKAKEYYQRAADRGYQSAQKALKRLEGQPEGPYTYITPEPAKPAPQPPQPTPASTKAKEKPKRGGLFGFFKK